MAYHFYLGDVELPIPPPSLRIGIEGRQTEEVLIDDTAINLLNGPKLVVVEFEFRAPQQQYPFAGPLQPIGAYYDPLRECLEKAVPLRFIVARMSPKGELLFDTNLLMSVTSLEQYEDADEGFDVLYSIRLRQYKPYGTKALEVVDGAIPASEGAPRAEPGNAGKTYTVAKGDALKHIAAAQLGDSARWTEIYETNKEAIEATARARGLGGSSNGYWIFPGQELVIP